VKRGNWEKAARSLTPQCPTISPSSDFGMKKEQLLLVAKKPYFKKNAGVAQTLMQFQVNESKLIAESCVVEATG